MLENFRANVLNFVIELKISYTLATTGMEMKLLFSL